jgi:hypothetical protein
MVSMAKKVEAIERSRQPLSSVIVLAALLVPRYSFSY